MYQRRYIPRYGCAIVGKTYIAIANHDTSSGPEYKCVDIIEDINSEGSTMAVTVKLKYREYKYAISYDKFCYSYKEKEDKEVAKLRINAVEPGMTLKAVNSMPEFGIFAGKDYIVGAINYEMIVDRHKIELYYPPTGGCYYLDEKDFIHVFDLGEDYMKNTDLRVELTPVQQMYHHNYITTLWDDDQKRGENLLLRGYSRYVINTAKLPIPKFIQINGDYTTAVWDDGTHTTVKLAEGDVYDEDEVCMILAFKKMFNNNNSKMRKYFSEYKKNVRRIKA